MQGKYSMRGKIPRAEKPYEIFTGYYRTSSISIDADLNPSPDS